MQLEIQLDARRAMIGMHYVWQDERILEMRNQVVGQHEVIYPPPQVLGSGTGTETPPGVLVFEPGMHVPETVGVTMSQKAAHPFPFFGQEPGMGRVSDRVVDVDCFVAYVVVSRQNQVRSCLSQIFHVRLEVFEPLHLERLALVTGCAGWMIDADDAQLPEVGSDKASFVVVCRYTHALFYVIGFLAAKQGYSTVPLFLRG